MSLPLSCLFARAVVAVRCAPLLMLCALLLVPFGCASSSSAGGTTSGGGADTADAGADTGGGAADAGGSSSSSGADVASSSGGADGGGAVDGAGTPCGNVTALGVCAGSVVKWCSEKGVLEQEDCKGKYGVGQVGVCIEVDKEHGNFCAVKKGNTCVGEDEDGKVLVEYCEGKTAGCVYGKTDAVCKENVFVCTDKDVGTCKNNLAIWACTAPQPAVTDCPEFGATCAVKGEDAVCTGVKTGGACDDFDVFCADGLACVGANATDWGKCTKK